MRIAQLVIAPVGRARLVEGEIPSPPAEAPAASARPELGLESEEGSGALEQNAIDRMRRRIAQWFAGAGGRPAGHERESRHDGEAREVGLVSGPCCPWCWSQAWRWRRSQSTPRGEARADHHQHRAGLDRGGRRQDGGVLHRHDQPRTDRRALDPSATAEAASTAVDEHAVPEGDEAREAAREPPSNPAGGRAAAGQH